MREKIVENVNFDLADCDGFVACLFREEREDNSKCFGCIFKTVFCTLVFGVF